MTDLDIGRTCAEVLSIDVYTGSWGELRMLLSSTEYSPLTDPAQNMECLWWLLKNSKTIVYPGCLLVSGSKAIPYSTRAEFMRAVCLAVCAVKEAGNAT